MALAFCNAIGGCGGGSGQSHAVFSLPFDTNPDGSLLPPVQVGKDEVKIVGLKNPSLEEAQFVHGVAIRPGTDQVNFAIAEIQVGTTTIAGYSDIVVPPGGILYITIRYAPKLKTTEGEVHHAVIEVAYGDPRPGIVAIEITGRAEGEPPVVKTFGCETAACIFEPTVIVTLSSAGVPDPPPPPKTASFSGPILIREENGEMFIDGLEFPYVILTFTSQEIGEATGAKIVLDGADGARGKVTLGDDGSLIITDFKVRVRLFVDKPGEDLASMISRTGPPNTAQGEISGVSFTTGSVTATGNKNPLTVTGQPASQDGSIKIVAGMTLPPAVFTEGKFKDNGNARLGGGALTAEISGRFERPTSSE